MHSIPLHTVSSFSKSPPESSLFIAWVTTFRTTVSSGPPSCVSHCEVSEPKTLQFNKHWQDSFCFAASKHRLSVVTGSLAHTLRKSNHGSMATVRCIRPYCAMAAGEQNP